MSTRYDTVCANCGGGFKLHSYKGNYCPKDIDSGIHNKEFRDTVYEPTGMTIEQTILAHSDKMADAAHRINDYFGLISALEQREEKLRKEIERLNELVKGGAS